MNCKDLNIKPCWACENNMIEKGYVCYIPWFRDHIKEGLELEYYSGGEKDIKDIFLFIINNYNEVDDKYMFWFQTAVNQYYPEHFKLISKISLLKE